MSIDTDYRVLRDVLNEYKPTGWAAEFGVYSGSSLAIIAEHMPVIGFDSFEGLPEDWREGFPKGSFATDGDEALYLPSPLYNQLLVKGWFEDTVPTFPFPDLGLVHIDCDLYSSTVTALEAVLPCIHPGTILVFDEFEGPDFDDEKRAWVDFSQSNHIAHYEIARGPEERAFLIEGVYP